MAETTKPIRKGDRKRGLVISSGSEIPERPPRPPALEEDVAQLSELVERMTASSIQAPSARERRQALFQLANEFSIVKPNHKQAFEVLDRMYGFQLDIQGRRYTIDRYLTRGSFGAIFVAVNPEGQERIIKISLPFFRPAMFVHPGATSRDVLYAEQIRSTVMEVAALHSLTKDWKNSGNTDGVPPFPLLDGAEFIPDPERPEQRIAAIVMEHVTGPDLDQMIAKWDFGQAPEEALEYIGKIIKSVQFLHGSGVVHADLKPANIKFDPQGRCKIVDFGSSLVQDIAKRQADRQHPRVVYGRLEGVMASRHYTTGYEDATVERDVYACGMIIMKMIYGSDFYKPKKRAEKLFELPSKTQQLVQLAEQMIQIDPEKRPSLAQVLEQLSLLGQVFSTG